MVHTPKFNSTFKIVPTITELLKLKNSKTATRQKKEPFCRDSNTRRVAIYFHAKILDTRSDCLV